MRLIHSSLSALVYIYVFEKTRALRIDSYLLVVNIDATRMARTNETKTAKQEKRDA